MYFVMLFIASGESFLLVDISTPSYIEIKTRPKKYVVLIMFFIVYRNDI